MTWGCGGWGNPQSGDSIGHSILSATRKLADRGETRRLLLFHQLYSERKQISLLSQFEKYVNEFEKIIENKQYDLENPSFSFYDAPIYYFMIKHYQI